MTDRELATALQLEIALEHGLRANDQAQEREDVRDALRHTIALQGSLKRLIAGRFTAEKLAPTG